MRTYVTAGVGIEHNAVFGNYSHSAHFDRHVSAQSVIDLGDRRHEDFVQRRQGHQGAERVPAAEFVIRAASGHACGVERADDRSRARTQRRHRPRARLLGWPRARARLLLQESVRQPARVPEHDGVAPGGRSAGGRRGQRVRRVREFPIVSGAGSRDVVRGAGRSAPPYERVVHLSRCRGDAGAQRVGRDQPGVPRRADRRVLSAGRPTAVPSSAEFRFGDGRRESRTGDRSRSPATSPASGTTAPSWKTGSYGNSLLLPNRNLDPAYSEARSQRVVGPSRRARASTRASRTSSTRSTTRRSDFPRCRAWFARASRILIGGDGAPAP